MLRCSHPEHVRLSAALSSSQRASQTRPTETVCLTCVTVQLGTWSAQVLFTHLCRVIAVTSSALLSREARNVVAECAPALVDLTKGLFQRVSTTASLSAECCEEEERLRSACFHWLRVLYGATQHQEASSRTTASQLPAARRSHSFTPSDSSILGADRDTYDTSMQRREWSSPWLQSIGECITQQLLQDLTQCLSCPRVRLADAAARVLFLSDLSAVADVSGELFLEHVCVGHLDEVVLLPSTVARIGGDSTLMELVLFWQHQVFSACRAHPESLERLATVIGRCGAPRSLPPPTTSAPDFVSSVCACFLDWPDSEPVVLNALSLLTCLMDAATTIQCVIPAHTSLTRHDEQDADGCGWIRTVVPLLLHGSRAVVRLAADVIQRVVVYGALPQAMLGWVEDCALEATDHADADTAEAALALLSTVASVSASAACAPDPTPPPGKGPRVLRSFFRLADLPSHLWVAAHGCTYFSDHLRRGTDVDAEAFANACLRQYARVETHGLSVAAGCFLEELHWLCTRRERAEALLPETLHALAHALLGLFSIPSQTPVPRTRLQFPALGWPCAVKEGEVAAYVIQAVVFLVGEPSGGGAGLALQSGLAELGARTLRWLVSEVSCAEHGRSLVSPPQPPSALWRAAASLMLCLLHVAHPMASLREDDKAESSTRTIDGITRDLLQDGLLDALVAFVPRGDAIAQLTEPSTSPCGDDGEGVSGAGESAVPLPPGTNWLAELVTALLCGGPFPGPDLRGCCDARSWAELIECATGDTSTGDALLFSLAAWDCPMTAVSESQLTCRLRTRVRACQPPSFSTASQADWSPSLMEGDDVSCGALDDWVGALECVVMLLWTSHVCFGRLPSLSSMNGETLDGTKSTPLQVLGMLHPHARQQLRPFLRWWSSMMPSAESSLFAFGQILMACEAWQSLGSALLLTCHLESSDSASLAEPRMSVAGPPGWLLQTTTMGPCRSAGRDDPLHALVSAALSHVHRLWAAQGGGAILTGTSCSDMRRLLELVHCALALTRVPGEEPGAELTESSRALHRHVLDNHLRPLLLASSLGANALAAAETVEDTLATTLVATLAGLSQVDVEAAASLGVRRPLTQLHRRLAGWVCRADATTAAGVYHALIPWLQLVYMCLHCADQHRLAAEHEQTMLLPILSQLRLVEQQATIDMGSTNHEPLVLAQVISLSALIRGVVWSTLERHAACAMPADAPRSLSSWWRLLPLEAIHHALGARTGDARDACSTADHPTPVIRRCLPWQSALLLLHVQSQFVSVITTGQTVIGADCANVSDISAEEMHAVEIVLDWSLSIFCTREPAQRAATRPDLSPVARLAAFLLRRYRHALSGSLHLVAFQSLCSDATNGLTTVEQGWIISGIACATPYHAWHLAMPPSCRDRALRELVEQYGGRIAQRSHKRVRPSDVDNARVMSHTLLCALESCFACLATAPPLAMNRIKDFLCTPSSQQHHVTDGHACSFDAAHQRFLFSPVFGTDVAFLATISTA